MASLPVPAIPTLYHCKWFCSSIPFQAIKELGLQEKVAVEEVTMEKLKTDPAIAEVNPRQVLPFLRLPSGQTIVEAAAILMYLLENYDVDYKMHPAPRSKDRAKFFQGVVFGVAEGYKTVVPIFMLSFGKKREERDREKIEELKKKFDHTVIGHIKHEFSDGRDYYLGEQFSAVDMVFGYVLMTAAFADEDLLTDPIVKAYHDRLAARETYMALYSPEEGDSTDV